jgi:hypothetical protein
MRGRIRRNAIVDSVQGGQNPTCRLPVIRSRPSDLEAESPVFVNSPGTPVEGAGDQSLLT